MGQLDDIQRRSQMSPKERAADEWQRRVARAKAETLPYGPNIPRHRHPALDPDSRCV